MPAPSSWRWGEDSRIVTVTGGLGGVEEGLLESLGLELGFT